jgi:oxygen-dependent protoporphyrinogen oxidase
MHRLIDSMVSNYLATGGTARFGSAVGKVSHSADGWLVELDGEAVIGTELVIATPPHSAAKILGGFSDLVAALTEVETVDTTLTTVLVEAEALNEFPLGTGALVDESLGLQVKATTHINAKWPWLDDSLSKNQHLIRFSFSESINGQGLDYEAAAIEALDCLYELKAAEILGHQVTLWKGALVRASSGHSTRVKAIQNLADQHGLGLAGAYLAGNGLAGLLRHNKKGKHIGTYA